MMLRFRTLAVEYPEYVVFDILQLNLHWTTSKSPLTLIKLCFLVHQETEGGRNQDAAVFAFLLSCKLGHLFLCTDIN